MENLEVVEGSVYDLWLHLLVCDSCSAGKKNLSISITYASLKDLLFGL